MKRKLVIGLTTIIGALACMRAFADGEIATTAMASASAINSGDTAWLMISAALVMLMTPGLAFFYGGLVRRKNVLSVLMQCIFILCLVTIQWVLFGYSLSFGPDIKGIICLLYTSDAADE